LRGRAVVRRQRHHRVVVRSVDHQHAIDRLLGPFPPQVKSVSVSFITYPVSACGGRGPPVGPPVAWQADGPRRTTSNCSAIKQEPWPAWNLPASGQAVSMELKLNVHFCTYIRERFPTSRVMGLGSNDCTGKEVQCPAIRSTSIRTTTEQSVRK
jgi:hypothetical protein